MRTNNKRKTTLSINMFISELGENFSNHMKTKLMELESRCFLARREDANKLDLRHVEHIKYEQVGDYKNGLDRKSKEYAYGQFVIYEGSLYFSNNCFENLEIMQAPEVNNIYNSLENKASITNEGDNYKKIDDDNIDYVVDRILDICPEESKAYLDIIRGMTLRASNK